MTPELLTRAVGCTKERAEVFAPHLTAACAEYEIDTPTRLAMFLAQVGHESGSFRHVRELWGPTPAQKRYEGRKDLGNVQSGDGERFKGHGLIQITGRANHRDMRERLRQYGAPDFEADPEALADPKWAAWSAACFWDSRYLNTLADAGNFEMVTRRINGGLNGYEDRLKRWEKAKRAFDQQEQDMPIGSFIAAALPSIVQAIGPLGKLFGSGSEVSERNVRAAELAVQIVQEATGAKNAQEAAELVQDPAIAQVASEAVQQRWHELTEVGGGIESARKADQAMVEGSGFWLSPSFWFMFLCLPLVYLVIGSVVGLWGNEWPAEVRASLATAVVSLIIGGGAGYYWGQTTSRNRK
jgi:putative chitinase